LVATQNNTHVTITPTQNITGHNANVPFTITLNSGQTYSAVATSILAGGHLQGSYISSDQPIAVTLKDDLVQVSSCADMIGDQTVPTSVLGTDYIVTRGFLQPNDEIYVLAIADGTSVYQDGNAAPVATLSKGQSVTLNLSNNSTFIHANQKIYVYQLTGNGCEVGSAIIPKLDCTGSQSVSVIRSNSDMCAFMITTKTGNQNSFMVNGNNTLVTGAAFSPVPGTGGAYVSARVDLSASVPIGTTINFLNSTGDFSLGFINGGTNDGTIYGYFSDFKSSSVQNSQVNVCQPDSAQLTAFGGIKYQWSPAAGLSNPNIANPKAYPSTTTNYKVIITSDEGCVDSATVNVKVYSAKNVDTTVSICVGDSYKLPSGKTENSTGTFNDTLYYASGCDSLVTTLHLTVATVTPSVSIAADQTTICAGTTVTFTATPVNGGAAPGYQWLVNGQNTGTNSKTYATSSLANGDKISCTMTSNATCVTAASAISNSIGITVSAHVAPSVSIVASDDNICPGSVVTFTAMPANGGSTPAYQWLVNGNNAGTNSPTFSSNTFTNGDQVSCIMTSNLTCVSPASATSNSLNVNVNPLVAPSVSIASSQTSICPGATVTFTATPTNGGNTPAYQWLLNGNNTGTNNATFSSNTLSNGDVISCRLTSDANCLISPYATSNNITITLNGPVTPAVSINISENNVCAGTPVTFTATPANGGTAPDYQWLVNGIGAGTNSATFTSATLANGDAVSCMMTSNATCATPVSIASASIIMAIFPLPIVTGGGDKTIKQGNTTVLTATAQGNIADITWSPATGLDNTKVLNPNASPLKTTVYTLTVVTTDGCTAIASVTVNVLEEITIPNTFTPNGDGVNDKWDIKNLADYQNCLVQVFTRWGVEVFNSKGYASPWDGTLNGKRLPIGTYYYIINLNNNTPPIAGFVVIIR